jgi:hypothetical protein
MGFTIEDKVFIIIIINNQLIFIFREVGNQ